MTFTVVGLNREQAVAYLTELGDTGAEENVETVSWHEHCKGHTVYLPNGGTVELKCRDNGKRRNGPDAPDRFEITDRKSVV